MNEITQQLKNLLSAKNIADATFLLAILIYLGCYLLLFFWEQKLGFFEFLAVILYGGLSIAALSVVSLIARGVFLYKNPAARNSWQKVLFVVAAIPVGSLLLKSVGLL